MDDPETETDWDPDLFFKKRYPHPIIHQRYKSSIKGIEVWQVNDKEDYCKDPVPFNNWIVAKGKKFPTDLEWMPKVLARVRFEPKTAAQAKEAALLRFRANGDAIIFLKEPFPSTPVPDGILKGVKPPEVRKEGDKYIVTFYVYHDSSHARFFGIDNRHLERYTVEVGKGHFQLFSDTLWSGDSESVNPLPGPGITDRPQG